MAENTLNPAAIEQNVRQNLLPQLFQRVGLNADKQILDDVAQIIRSGVAGS